MSLAAYIAFYSSDIQERTADGLICKRPAGNTYKIQDDAWALDFYYAHKDDTAAQLVNAVLTNTQMWDQDLTKIEGLEAAVLADLEMIRTQGGDDLLVQHLVHKAAHGIVVHTVANDIKACQISAQHKAGVCAVQDADLALLVRAQEHTSL